MSKTSSNTDLAATFLLGAAISTGNPAVSELGIIGTALPLVVIAIIVALAGGFGEAAERGRRLLVWPAALYVAFIFLWYEQYKLLGHPGSVALFTTLTDWLGVSGHEHVMRIGVACAEITASLFILVPALQGLGGLGAIAVMTGAIFFHVATPLGVDPYGDGGVLFKEAISVWTAGWIVVWFRRDQLLALAGKVGVPVPSWAAAR